ncbi:DUF58 domain-containing protein [Streptomyces sp. NBC_00249]|uniref:DUF58 domain-containing protein n=1 Tax=Streptomyces sp. NBC_00249 TaxID=2975690 RepID=UPI002258085C|nr:DUF58 domain-containing protein [Streptomyces sp. NBC_00249]MCX5192401.1 DUF58 domain-containing protein [Streptomyces sp. NBC_00249]
MITARGSGVLGVCLLLPGCAWLLGTATLAAPAVGGLVTLGAAALLVRAAARNGVSARLDRASVTRGEAATLTADRPAVPAWIPLVYELLPGQGTPAEHRRAASAGGGERLVVRLPTEHHGVLVLGPSALRVRDPLGLFHRESRAGAAQTLRVLPRTLPVPGPGAGRTRSTQVTGRPLAHRDGPEFHTLREYRPGDDVRRIHWPSSARTSALVVRQDTAVEEPTRYVWLDTRAVCYPDRAAFEEAVDTAASLAADAARRGLALRLWTSEGAVLSAPPGPSGSARSLEFLTEVAPTGAVPGQGRPSPPAAAYGGTAGGRSRGPYRVAAQGLLTVVTGESAAGHPLPAPITGGCAVVALHLGSAAPRAEASGDGPVPGAAPVRHRHARDAEQALLLWAAAARAPGRRA